MTHNPLLHRITSTLLIFCLVIAPHCVKAWSELARPNPEVLFAIQRKLDEDLQFQINILSTEELEALSDQLGLDP